MSAGLMTEGTTGSAVRSSTAAGGLGEDACPYQGLAPFSAEDAELFFGRVRATRDLLERLGRRLDGHGSILMVSGASGVGKSSLLRAGLMPALERGMLLAEKSQRWPCRLMTPTSTPLRTLAQCWTDVYGGRVETVLEQLREDPRPVLSGAHDGRLVLIVDQFEELFTLVSDEQERQRFVRTLHAMAEGPPGAAVIIGVRADYWDRCAAYPQFAAAIQDGQVIVEPMTDADLRLAITGPAAAVGLEIESGLVETMLSEVRGGRGDVDRYEAGALPLLSQALRSTWKRQEHGRLTVRGYEESGGIQDAVQQTADEVFRRLSAEDRKTALKAFRRMTLITTGRRVARRPVTLAELYAAVSAHSAERRGQVNDLVSAFADQRLLTLHENTVEVAHDALLTVWPTLRQWLAPDLSARTMYDQLIEDAAQWYKHHRDPAYLYRGARLLAVRDTQTRWSRDPDSFPPPGPAPEAFIAASTRAARRTERKRRLVLAGLAVLTAVALVATGAAVNAANDADQQRFLAVSRQLAAQSELAGDPATSALLAAAAWRIAPTPEARHRMLDAAARPSRAVLYGHHSPVTELAFSPDGSVIATGSDDGTVRLWDTATRQQTGAPIVHPREECSRGVNAVAFSPDGKALVTACFGRVRFWDTSTQRELGISLNNQDPISAIALSPTGRTLATASINGTIRLWDVADRRQRGDAMAVGRSGSQSDSRQRRLMAVNAVAFSPDGTRLATANADHTARLWDTATHRQIGAAFTGHAGAVQDVTFSPDGAALATASGDGTARLWNLATHRETGPSLKAPFNNYGFYGIAFSPDGKRLATAGAKGAIRLWDVKSHRSLGLVFADSRTPVRRVAFSPDGKLLAGAGDDGVVRLGDPLVHRQIGNTMPGGSVIELSPDGKILATGDPGDDSTILLWDVATQRRIGRALHPTPSPVSGHDSPAYEITFSPDGATIAIANSDGIRLWDTATQQQIGPPIHFEGRGNGMAFSPDGKLFATWHDPSIQVWKIAARRQIASPITLGYTDTISGTAFSPDGTTLAIASNDHTVRLFDLAAHRQIGGPLPVTASGILRALVFSPDGTTLAIAAADDTVRLWDVAGHHQIAALVGHTDWITAIAFNPDGKTLVTSSADHTARLWDLMTHRQIGIPLTGYTGSVTDVAYSKDGTTVATVGDDRTARLWNVALPADLLATTCANAGRSFTRAEWRRYIPGEEFRRVCR
jgi:WD40 repeat protein